MSAMESVPAIDDLIFRARVTSQGACAAAVRPDGSASGKDSRRASSPRLFALVCRLLLPLLSALGLALGLQLFSAEGAFAAACPNGTDLLSGVTPTSFTTGNATSAVF